LLQASPFNHARRTGIRKGQRGIDTVAWSSVEPMALSHEEKIGKFVDSIDKKLRIKDSTYSHLSVILSNCGWQKKGPNNVGEINDALELRGIYTQPTLTKSVPYDSRVYFHRDHREKPLLFADEDHLRDFLVDNFHRIDDFADLVNPKPEFHLQRSGKKIDILCRERGTGAYVVVELKRDFGTPVTQIHEYLDEVSEDLAKEQFDVKGIIITGRPMPLAADYSTIGGFPVQWLTYNVGMTLAET
jgi:hypothetical protein